MVGTVVQEGGSGAADGANFFYSEQAPLPGYNESWQHHGMAPGTQPLGYNPPYPSPSQSYPMPPSYDDSAHGGSVGVAAHPDYPPLPAYNELEPCPQDPSPSQPPPAY